MGAGFGAFGVDGDAVGRGNVYLDGGSDQGIAKGDTLVLNSDAQRSFLVIAAARKQSIVQFAGDAFPVTRGQLLMVRVVKGNETTESVPDTDVEEEGIAQEQGSIMDQPVAVRTEPRRPRSRSKVEIDGRLILDFSALQSSTRVRSSTVPAASRLYLTPTVNLSTTVRNLPSGMKMHIHLRSDYRYQSRNPIAPNNSFRAYQLSLEKPLPFGTVRFGRFYNRMTQRGGYWDGVSFLYGTRRRGIGGSVGFMPERSNEGFSTQFPRYALFAHYQTDRSKTVSYRGAIAYNEIQPTSDLMKHQYASLEQRIDVSILSLRQDIQVDYNPLSQQWMVSHLRLGGRLSLGRDVDLTGTYTIRQPYRMTNLLNPFMSRRDQYRAGISLHKPLFSVGSSYTRRFLNQSYEGQTVTGYFNTRPITPLALSFTGSASRWESQFGDALYLNGGIAKRLNKIYVRADYAFYRTSSPNVANRIDMHRITLTTSVPFSQRLYWTMRASAQQSQFTEALSLQTSLQIRF